MKKKGLSPVVASVLLIVMVVGLVAFIFGWARGFVFDQTSDIPTGKICGEAAFGAEVFLVSGNNYVLEIVNKGDVDISSFVMKVSFEGTSEIEEIPTGVDAGESVSVGIELDSGRDVEIAAVLVEDDGVPLKEPAVCWDDAVGLNY